MPFPARQVSKEKTSAQKGPNRGLAKRVPAVPTHHEAEDDNHSDIGSEINEELDISESDDDARLPPVNKNRATIRKPSKPKANDPTTKVAPHMMMITAVKHLTASEIVYGGKSYFTPNAWMMYKILNIMHENCAENTSIHKFCAPYHVGLSRIYYGVLWFIQILRARQAANALSQSEFQFLRFFETAFRFEELPIAGPLVVYFNNLASFKPAGNTYDFVVPKLPILSGNSATNVSSDASHLKMPPLPFMIDVMYKFSNMTENQLGQALQNDQFEPFAPVTGGTLAGVQSGPNFATFSRIQKNTLSVPGMTPVWPHSTQTLLQKRLPIKRMHIPDVSADPKNTVKSFCGFDNSLDWFSKVITVAGSEARYFHGSTVLANIGPTTGASVTAVAVHAARSRPITVPTSWYPEFPLSLSATISSPEILSPDDFHIGAVSGVSYVISDSTDFSDFSGLGSRAAGHKTGDYFSNNMLRYSTNTVVNPTSQLDATVKFNFYRPKGGERDFLV